MSSQLDYEINKELGECYLFMGDFDKAENYYRKAVDSSSDHSDPFLGLATIAVQRGLLDDALTLYSKAITIEENDKAIAGLGLVKMEMGEHADAFDYFERAVRLNPENSVALNCLVREGYNLNQLDRVIPCLEASLAVLADNEEVRTSLAGCLVSLGRENEALDHLKALLEQNPNNTNARDLYEHVKNM